MIAVGAALLISVAAIEDGDDAGSLIETSMRGTVGVVLDEIPGSLRDQAANASLATTATEWRERAARQLRLTRYRLVFRDAFYDDKGQLPLPPEPKWQISLIGKPERRTVQGHDVVAVNYRFSSVLVTDSESPGRADSALRKVGGVVNEPFNLPVDPELLFQRTGYACMDEEDFPFNAVDSEEVDSFFDQDVVPEAKLSNVGQSHFTRGANESCLKALRVHVGRIDTRVRFERLPWSADKADAYRFGAVTGAEPDLKTYRADHEVSRIVYRYINPDACEVEEKAVDGTGWRRLLQFPTSDENVGERALAIGAVNYTLDDKAQPLDSHRLFEFSACHRHFHFKYYGNLVWRGSGAILNKKQGFCLQSTDRVANRESSPLVQPFGSCHFQGIASGWADQYKAGLPGQWLDTTNLPPGEGQRVFDSNPDGLLCEGTLLNSSDDPLGGDEQMDWRPTKFEAADGAAVQAPACRLRENHAGNNRESVLEEILPHGQGQLTQPCTRGQIGPLRNCGFGAGVSVFECRAGAPTSATFSIPDNSPPQVVRLAEYSRALGSPIPARYEDSWVPRRPGESDQAAMLANVVVMPGKPLVVEFGCPGPRQNDATEPGGAYSVYTAPVLPDNPAAPVRHVTPVD